MFSKISSKITALLIVLVGTLSWPFMTSGTYTAQAAAAPAKAAIEDSLILEGWNELRNLKDPIRMGNGETLSGEKLARYLLEQQIPVVWGSQKICKGSSCSRLYCSTDGKCSYGSDPIYLNPSIQKQTSGQKSRVARDLAHEIYHRMRPFGDGTITQIEEYWAFYVEAQVVKADWPKFDHVDPQNPQQLENWFRVHTLTGYLKLAPYPGSKAPSTQVTTTYEAAASQ
jgi:hypothetical protein